MHEPEKSDPVVVAGKPMNKAEQSATESVERRAGAKGNADQQSTRRAQNRESVSQALGRVRQAAGQRKKERFTSLLHHIDPAMLRTAFYAIKRDAAPGVDGMIWETYERDLDRRIGDLHARVKSGAYRAQPYRRSYIPKEDGSKRPLAVAALEDKIVQRATAAMLSAIYEEDFLGFSYGFRTGRSPHDALDALIVGISSTKVNFILDADIRSFFTEVSQEWLVRFLEHRIGDKRIIRLVQKWLRAGVLEDGIVTIEEKGTGQGSVISPLLANAYLHYVFDLWAERWRRRGATGDMIMVRYADDLVVGFEHESDARRFWDAMRDRLREFSLSLQRRGDRRIPLSRRHPLASFVTPSQSESPAGVGADEETGGRLPPAAENPSPVAKRPLRRQTPEVGAECPNWARSDLCGGRPEMSISTANSSHVRRSWKSVLHRTAGPYIWHDCDIARRPRSEEHTSELQSRPHLVCRLLLEKKKKN